MGKTVRRNLNCGISGMAKAKSPETYDYGDFAKEIQVELTRLKIKGIEIDDTFRIKFNEKSVDILLAYKEGGSPEVMVGEEADSILLENEMKLANILREGVDGKALSSEEYQAHLSVCDSMDRERLDSLSSGRLFIDIRGLIGVRAKIEDCAKNIITRKAESIIGELYFMMFIQNKETKEVKGLAVLAKIQKEYSDFNLNKVYILLLKRLSQALPESAEAVGRYLDYLRGIGENKLLEETRLDSGGTIYHDLVVSHSKNVLALLKGDTQLLKLTDSAGNSVLHWMAEHHAEKIKELIGHNEDLLALKNDSGSTPLHFMAIHNVEILKEFVTQNLALLTITNNDKHSVLHWVARFNAKSVGDLIQRDKSLLKLSDNAGNSVLHWMAEHHADKIKELIGHNKDLLELKNDSGSTPLHFMAKHNVEILREFVTQNRTLLTVTNNDKHSVLHWAAKFNAERVGDLIDVDKNLLRLPDNAGNSVLHWMAEHDADKNQRIDQAQ